MTVKMFKMLAGVLCVLALAACSKPKESPTARMLAWVASDSEAIVSVDIVGTLDSGFVSTLESKLPPEADKMNLKELKPAIKDVMERGVVFGMEKSGGLLFYSPSCADLKSLQPKLDMLLDKVGYKEKSELGKLGDRSAIMFGGATGAAVICLEENIFLLSSNELMKSFGDMKKRPEHKCALIKDIEPLLSNPICGVFESSKGELRGVSVFKVSFEGAAGDEINVMADVAFKDAATAKQIAGDVKMQTALVFGMVAQQDKALLEKLNDGFKCNQREEKVEFTAHYSCDTLVTAAKNIAPMLGQLGQIMPVK